MRTGAPALVSSVAQGRTVNLASGLMGDVTFRAAGVQLRTRRAHFRFCSNFPQRSQPS